ncbi:MAG: galactose oxidase-like domain-containing protein [Thermoplasmatota archaeon]
MKPTAFLLAGLVFGVLFAGCASPEEPQPAPGTWVAPEAVPGVDDPTLSKTGRWLAPFEGEVPAVNMGLLPGGDVLYYSGVEARETAGPTELTFFTSNPHEGESRVLTLRENGFEIRTPELATGGGGDLFCSGHTLLADGTILAAGGSDWHNQPNLSPFLAGSTDSRVFDPATGNWTVGSDMVLGRWYPTVLSMPNGDAMAISGIGDLTNPMQQWEQMEQYENGTWSAATAEQLLPLYPRVFVVPSGPMEGHLFYNTVGTMWGPFGEHPRELEWSFQYEIDPEVGVTQLDRSVYGGRQHANSVMLPLLPSEDYAAKLLTFGGSLYQTAVATPFAEIADLSTYPPANTATMDLAHARWHANGVLLPTGEVMAIGGGIYDNVILHGQPNIAVMTPELFDPATETWTELPEMSVERMYHSSAILLDDGRVLAGGHVPLPNPSPTLRDTVQPQIAETRLEIYEPGYLFRGERPHIAGGNTTGHHGGTLDVVVGGEVSGFVLARPGQTTHAWDNSQRVIGLEWAQPDGDGYNFTVTLPPNANVAPPGDYMLFALRNHPDGDVPSDGYWIRIENV